MSRKDKLIKSKSIYTIRKKHQTLSDATIYENDHVTIIRDDGIFNTDMPLFSDSNFKFRIRSGGNGKKKHNRYGWITNEFSDDNVFTLSNMPENNSITDESKIVQKPNYSSLRDFAYYGSAVELVKATVNDIIMRYPGGISYYSGLDAPEVWVEGRRYFLVSNEFNIDFWTPKGVSVDEIENPMRVLGASYMNYEDKDGNDINLTICITGNCLDTIIGRVSFSNYYVDNNNSNNNLLGVRNSLQKSGVRHNSILSVHVYKEIENGNQIDIVGEKVKFIVISSDNCTRYGVSAVTDSDGIATCNILHGDEWTLEHAGEYGISTSLENCNLWTAYAKYEEEPGHLLNAINTTVCDNYYYYNSINETRNDDIKYVRVAKMLTVSANTLTQNNTKIPIRNETVYFHAFESGSCGEFIASAITDNSGVARIYLSEDYGWRSSGSNVYDLRESTNWTAYMTHDGITQSGHTGSEYIGCGVSGYTNSIALNDYADEILFDYVPNFDSLIVRTICSRDSSFIGGVHVVIEAVADGGCGYTINGYTNQNGEFVAYNDMNYGWVWFNNGICINRPLLNDCTTWKAYATYNGITQTITNNISDTTEAEFQLDCVYDYPFMSVFVYTYFGYPGNASPLQGADVTVRLYDSESAETFNGNSNENGFFEVGLDQATELSGQILHWNCEATYNGETVYGQSINLMANGSRRQYLYFLEEPQHIDNYRLVVSAYTIDALTDIKTPIVNEVVTFVVAGINGEKCSKSAITDSHGIAYVYLSDNGWVEYDEPSYTVAEILSTATCWFAFMEHNGETHSGITQTSCTPPDDVLMTNTNPIETKKWDEIDFYETSGWGFCDNEITVHCFYHDDTLAENIPISVSSITDNGDLFITLGTTDSNGDFSVHGNPNDWVHFGENHGSNIYEVNSFSACGFYNNDVIYGYLSNPNGDNCVINIMFKKKLEPIEFDCDAIDDCNYKWFDIYLDGDGIKHIVTDTNNHYDLGGNDLCIIRPKRQFRNEFWDNLDDFERVLLDRDTTPIYTARLETPYTIDNFYYYNLKTYTWPTVDGVTPDLTTSRFHGYLNSLISLAQYHDEFDSDNLWRMMTHESIKNLDWTFMRINDSDSSSDDEDNGLDSSRMRGTLNVYGRFFDDLKRYADNIKSTNNISYDEKNNLPDYFLTDSVEIGGFEATSISSFSAISTDFSNTQQIDDNFKKTLSTVNSNFMRRLSINETYIHSLKGTRNGLKSILGLFGYKENSGETPTTTAGEFDIHEYVAIANNFPSYAETSRLRSLVDYVNYDENTNFMKGYPVAVVSPLGENSDEYDYYLIPWFNSNETYKYPFYFQQKGGWGKIMTKEINEPITIASSITEDYDVSIYGETEPYMKFVSNIEELKSISNNAVFENMVCYVTDISKMYEEYEDAPGEYPDDERLDYSHYFILKNISLSNYIGFVDTDLYYCYGWRNIRLREFTGATPTTRDGLIVLYLESIIENSKDNNPHFGKGEYDDGASYIEKFNLIFGDDLDYGVFDFLKDGDQEDLDNYEEISTLGFDVTNMVENNKKCYYFEDSQSQIQYRTSIDENPDVFSVPMHTWTETIYTLIPVGEEDSYDYSDYEDFVNPENADDHVDEAAANSIVNVKNLVINFGTNGNLYIRKYIEKTVIPYLEHMIPSTTILRYKFDNVETNNDNNEIESKK